MDNTFSYYARNDSEKEFDDWVRDTVMQNGNIAEHALYIQNQAILSMLRHIEDKLELSKTE